MKKTIPSKSENNQSNLVIACLESRARAESEERKDAARSPKAPKVSKEKGTRRREEEVEREE